MGRRYFGTEDSFSEDDVSAPGEDIDVEAGSFVASRRRLVSGFEMICGALGCILWGSASILARTSLSNWDILSSGFGSSFWVIAIR